MGSKSTNKQQSTIARTEMELGGWGRRSGGFICCVVWERAVLLTTAKKSHGSYCRELYSCCSVISWISDSIHTRVPNSNRIYMWDKDSTQNRNLLRGVSTLYGRCLSPRSIHELVILILLSFYITFHHEVDQWTWWWSVPPHARVHAKYEFKSYHLATLMSILSNQYIKILATPLQYNRKEWGFLHQPKTRARLG